jgi:hypothetical protein
MAGMELVGRGGFRRTPINPPAVQDSGRGRNLQSIASSNNYRAEAGTTATATATNSSVAGTTIINSRTEAAGAI